MVSTESGAIETEREIVEVHYLRCTKCRNMFAITERETANNHICTGAYVWRK